MKLGIIREEKLPADKRVALSPEQCKKVISGFPGTEIFVQESDARCIPDEEYKKAGIPVVSDVSDCDVLLGIKEVPIDALIPEKNICSFRIPLKSNPTTGRYSEIFYLKISN